MREILKKPVNYLKEGFSSLSESLSEGWEYLKKNTRTALTKFRACDDEWDIPEVPSQRWGFMANDIYCTNDEIIVRLEVPGMNREDLNVMAYDNYLVVKGQKKREREEKRSNYYISQCAYGEFYRTIPLPYRAKSEEVKAKYKNGVLMVKIPYETNRRAITIS